MAAAGGGLMQNPNSAVKKAKLWSEAALISLRPLCLSLPPPESGWVGRPPGCLSASTLALQALASQGCAIPASGQSCALKPEIQLCVVIPAGETALALSGALAQLEAGVTGGLSTSITRLCSCAAPTSTVLFIEPRSAFLLRLGLTTNIRELRFWWGHVINYIELQRLNFPNCWFGLRNFRDECFTWPVLSVITPCQRKYNAAVICYVYVGQFHSNTLICKVTRKSGLRKIATLSVCGVKCLNVWVFAVS